MADFIDELMQLKKEFSSTIGDLEGISRDIVAGLNGKELPSEKEQPSENVVAMWDSSRRTTSPGIDYNLCKRTRAPHSNCTACIDVCPAHALRANDEVIALDSSKCLGCGLCSSVCPTTAIRAQGFDQCWINERMAGIASSYEALYLTCTHALKRQPPENIFVLPCLAVVSPELWMSLLADFIDVSVYLPLGCCDSCPIGVKAQDIYADAIEKGETWSRMNLGFECAPEDIRIDALHTAERQEFIDDLMQLGGKTVKSLTRKNPLIAGATKTKNVVMRYSKQFDAMNSQLDRICGVKDIKRLLVSNRKLLLTTLSKHRELGAEVQFNCAVVDTTLCDRCAQQRSLAQERIDTGTAGEAWGARSASARATQDSSDASALRADTRADAAADDSSLMGSSREERRKGRCNEACPTGAIQLIGTSAEVETSYCIGCGLCADVCPTGACSLTVADGSQLITRLVRKGFDVDALFDQGKKAALDKGKELASGARNALDQGSNITDIASNALGAALNTVTGAVDDVLGVGTKSTVSPSTWICSCGHHETGKFCGECGAPAPSSAHGASATSTPSANPHSASATNTPGASPHSASATSAPGANPNNTSATSTPSAN